MVKVIGPSFPQELQAAGLAGLPISWGDDGVFGLERLTPEQRAEVEAVLAAHVPTLTALNPVVDGKVFMGRLTDIELSAIMNSALTNPKLTRWLENLRMGGDIDVSSAESSEVKTGLVTRAVLTAARAGVVFAPN